MRFTVIMILFLVAMLSLFHLKLVGMYGFAMATMIAGGAFLLEGLGYLFLVIVPLWDSKKSGKLKLSFWMRFVLEKYYTVDGKDNKDDYDCLKAINDDSKYKNLCYLGTSIWMCLHFFIPMVVWYVVWPGILRGLIWRTIILKFIWGFIIKWLICNVIWDKGLRGFKRLITRGAFGADCIPWWVLIVCLGILALYINPVSRHAVAPVMLWIVRFIVPWGATFAVAIGILHWLFDEGGWDDIACWLGDVNSSQWGKLGIWMVPTVLLLFALSPLDFAYWGTLTVLGWVVAAILIVLAILLAFCFCFELSNYDEAFNIWFTVSLGLGVLLILAGATTMGILAMMAIYTLDWANTWDLIASFAAILGLLLLWAIVARCWRGLILYIETLRKKWNMNGKATAVTKKRVRGVVAKKTSRVPTAGQKAAQSIGAWCLVGFVTWLLHGIYVELYVHFKLSVQHPAILWATGLTVFALAMKLTRSRETLITLWGIAAVPSGTAIAYWWSPKWSAIVSRAEDAENGICPIIPNLEIS